MRGMRSAMAEKNIIEQQRWFFRRKRIPYPLDECYKREKRKLPRVTEIVSSKIPKPYKSLLVHNHDMTSTLEKFHGGRIHLSMLRNWQENDFYFREVALTLDENERRVEFGAIKINLRPFQPEARQKILDAKLPLGRILSDYNVAYHSNPRFFFTIEADELIQSALQLSSDATLYGRQNTLSTLNGETLAEIVEILPP